MMKKLLLFGLISLSSLSYAQYVSPGTGITVKIQDIETADPTTVSLVSGTTDKYWIHKDITITANDTFVLDENLTFYFKDNVLFTVGGTLNAQAPEKAIFTVNDPETEKYQGFRLEEGSTTTLKNIAFFYSGGIRGLAADILVDNCEFEHTHSGISTSGVISFSRGLPVVKNSRFENNQNPAVGSAANAGVGLVFENNYLYNNNMANSNRAQINMGPSGEGQTQYFRNNTVIGNRANTRAGGIASSSLVGVPNYAVIENNTVKDNRYGITIVGVNSGGEIIGNTLLNNDSEGNPMLGGSGISISQTADTAANEIKIFDNIIRNHIWGITLIGNGTKINMGDASRNGGNVFADNANNDVTYALYNNSANEVTAIGNCWIENQSSTTSQVEDVIYHQPDDSTLGLVDYSNFTCNLNTTEVSKFKVEIYPNPVQNVLNIKSDEKIKNVEIINTNGQIVLQSKSKSFNVSNLNAGVYILKIVNAQGKTTTHKFIKK